VKRTMDKVVTISGKKLELTNVEKLLWRQEGLTKLDLISYYSEMAVFILPYLRIVLSHSIALQTARMEKAFFRKT